MWLIQILLPLYDNSGKPIPRVQFQNVKKELTDRFHGLTAYSRSVAKGFWGKGPAKCRDDIIVYEVMASGQDKAWWKCHRSVENQPVRVDSKPATLR
jgi:hypothetical protein